MHHAIPLLFAALLVLLLSLENSVACSGDAVSNLKAGFVAVRNEDELQCRLGKELDPLNDVWATEAYRFAEQLAVWVASLFPANGTTTPKIKFAYYPALLGELGSCTRNRVGKYARSEGAGAAMCQLLQDTSSLGAGTLTDYLVQLLDVGKTEDANGDPQEFFDSVGDIASLVRQLGFEPYQRFVHSFNTKFVYNPTDNKFGYMNPSTIQSLSAQYLGLSGGGGSGAGFGIFCRHANGTQETVFRGGGGGGAGGSAPAGPNQTLEAGGGGSGGVTTGTSADGIIRIDPITKLPVYAPQVYAVADLSPFGKVSVYPDPVLDSSYNMAVSDGVKRIQSCKSRGGEVWISGGGGGGAGYEWFTTAPSAGGAGSSKTALNLGWGFQFAIGEGNKLTRHGLSKVPRTVMVCPYLRSSPLRGNRVDWQQCYPQEDDDEVDDDDDDNDEDSVSATSAPTSQPTTSVLYGCLGQVIPQVCGKATYFDTQTNKTTAYTKYGNYVGCNCPLSNWYKEAYGTMLDKVYEPQCKGPKPSSPRYVPVLTRDAFDIKWCDGVKWKTCPVLKECLSRSPTVAPSAAPTLRPTTASPNNTRAPTTTAPSRRIG